MKSIPLILVSAGIAFGQGAVFRAGQPPPPPTSFDCAADGAVVNSVTGEPVIRAHVTVTAAGGAYSTASDASGKWTLSNMACAPGQLQVTRPGFLQNGNFSTMQARGYQNLTLVSGSPVHDVKSELTPQSVAFGKVVDDQGDPIMGAQVTALTARIVEGKPRFQQTGTGASNDLGEYRIANLARGKYIVCVRVNPLNAPAAAASTVMNNSCYPGPVEGGMASAMDLAAGRETKVDFTLNEVPAVHVRGEITGLPEGRGSGLRIVTRGMDFGANFPGNVRDGKFDFRLPPGSYMLAADYFEAGKRLIARVPVDVGSTDIDNVVVHLDSGFTVTGVVQVVSQSGRTLSQQFGANLRSMDPTGGAPQIRWEPDHTSFAINEMVPGSYRLDAFPPPPFYVKSAMLGGQDILSAEVPISQAAGPIDIQLRDDGGSIEGDVVDANGQPAAAGIILLRGTIRAANVIAQANGHFKLQNVAPGDYAIYAWDQADQVPYADPDWMRRNGGGGMSITVAASQSQQIKLTEQLVPPQ